MEDLLDEAVKMQLITPNGGKSHWGGIILLCARAVGTNKSSSIFEGRNTFLVHLLTDSFQTFHYS